MINSRFVLIGMCFCANIHLFSQTFTDTIYSGRKTRVDFSKSISNSYNNSLLDLNFYRSDFSLGDEKCKATVPFILYRNAKKILKNDALLNYNAIIYTIYTKQDSPIHETVFMEMFFENENLAEKCIKSLIKLQKIYKENEYKDIVENKNELYGQMEHYNCYFARKKNIVYFIYNMLPDTLDNQIIHLMTQRLLNIIY